MPSPSTGPRPLLTACQALPRVKTPGNLCRAHQTFESGNRPGEKKIRSCSRKSLGPLQGKGALISFSGLHPRSCLKVQRR